MNRQHNAVASSLTQAQTFLNRNASLLPSVNATDTRRALDDAIARLATHSTAQNANTRVSKGARNKQVAARAVLLEHHMQAIAAVARGELSSVPEFAGLSGAMSKTRTADLIASAEGMANVAATRKDVFAAALGADFLDQLNAAIKQLQDARSLGVDSRAQRSAATAGLSAEAARGRNAVKVLDPLVKRALAGNVGLLREWKNKRKISVDTQSALTVASGGSTPAPAAAATDSGPATPAGPSVSDAGAAKSGGSANPQSPGEAA